MGAVGISLSQPSRALISSTVLDQGVIKGDIPAFSVFLMKQNRMFPQIAVLRQKEQEKKREHVEASNWGSKQKPPAQTAGSWLVHIPGTISRFLPTRWGHAEKSLAPLKLLPGPGRRGQAGTPAHLETVSGALKPRGTTRSCPSPSKIQIKTQPADFEGRIFPPQFFERKSFQHLKNVFKAFPISLFFSAFRLQATC